LCQAIDKKTVSKKARVIPGLFYWDLNDQAIALMAAERRLL
jgi:hypothetical protein